MEMVGDGDRRSRRRWEMVIIRSALIKEKRATSWRWPLYINYSWYFVVLGYSSKSTYGRPHTSKILRTPLPKISTNMPTSKSPCFLGQINRQNDVVTSIPSHQSGKGQATNAEYRLRKIMENVRDLVCRVLGQNSESFVESRLQWVSKISPVTFL